MSKKQAYCEGSWDTLTFLLNYLNTLEDKKIKKADLYKAVMKFRPEDVLKSSDKLKASHVLLNH